MKKNKIIYTRCYYIFWKIDSRDQNKHKSCYIKID